MIQVYRNLHKKCWSIREKGKRIQHAHSLIMDDCTFHVQPAGHRRVIKELRKNVHAYVKGTRSKGPISRSAELNRVSYNPYRKNYFVSVEKNEKIESAKRLLFSNNGKVYEIN